MAQLEHIEAIEKRLWSATDTLRANSNYASNEYFLPVMGLVFLRHAYSRFLGVKDAIEAGLPARGGKIRPLTKDAPYAEGFTILSPAAIPFSYLYLFTTIDDFVGHLVNHIMGASYPAVRPDDFERTEILLPAQSVLKIFHEKMGPAFRMIQALEKEINALAEARDILLPKLMNGEVAV